MQIAGDEVKSTSVCTHAIQAADLAVDDVHVALCIGFLMRQFVAQQFADAGTIALMGFLDLVSDGPAP